jgi:uncharacterized membrane protein
MEQYANYDIMITNTGGSEDTFTLTKNSPPEDWQTQLSIQIITIPSHESRYITLKVKPTCECESGVKVYINVTATSESDPNVFDIAQTITTFANVKISLESNTNYVQIEREESYIYEINVTNEGSEIDTFWLTVFQTPQLSVVLEEEYITLDSNESRSMNLGVKALQSAPFGYYELNVTGVSIHNSDKNDILTITMIIGQIELIARNISLSNKHPKEGETVLISFEIYNNGSVNAKDIMITTYYITKDDTEIEIESKMVLIGSKKTILVQHNMEVNLNFTGLSIEAKIKSKYEIWKESFTKEELGLEFEQQGYLPYYLIGLIGLVILIIIVFLIILWKKKRK